MKRHPIAVPKDTIADFCRRHHIARLAFFGSVLRDDLRPDSDIDVLVDFEPGHVPGLALIRMEDELGAILGGRRIDLVTPKSLNRHIRNRIVAEAKPQYVAPR